MIQTFSVKNFLSIGAKQVLSFEATPDKSNIDELSVEVKPGVKLLRLILLYGPNASGKSNVLYAVETLWSLLFHPQIKEHAKIPFYKPFANHNEEPTEFSIIFWALGRKFKYDISYNEFEVLNESMMYTTDSGILSKLYTRTKEDGITFGTTFELKSLEKNNLKANTLPNHTVLSTLNKINVDIPILNGLYQWIKFNIHKEDSHSNIKQIAQEALNDRELKSMILQMLNKADIDISDFELIQTQTDISQELRDEIPNDQLYNSLRNQLFKNSELIFTHTAENNKFKISANMESQGTLMYFRLAYILYNLKNNNCIYLKDEIEDCLHYDLLIHYLKMFLEMKCRNQLICTTHNLSLLSEDWMIRRDMVWFTEKNKVNGETEISRASSFGLHKNISLENAYRIGKLGAKPKLGST